MRVYITRRSDVRLHLMGSRRRGSTPPGASPLPPVYPPPLFNPSVYISFMHDEDDQWRLYRWVEVEGMMPNKANSTYNER